MGHTDITSLIVYAAIAVLVVWRVVFRQLRGSTITVRGLALFPGILLVLGIYNIAQALPRAAGSGLGLLGADLAVLLILGVARGGSTHLGLRNGVAFQKGTTLTLVLWVVTIAVRIGFAVVGARLHTGGTLTSASILLSMGLSIGVQNVIIFTRARRGQLPIATSRADAAPS